MKWETPAYAALMLVIAILSITFYDRFIRPRVTFGYVNVKEVYKAKEAQFAALVTRPGATSAERDQALRMAEQFSRDMTKALGDMPLECKCVILAHDAIAGYPEGMLDLTPELKKRVGL